MFYSLDISFFFQDNIFDISFFFNQHVEIECLNDTQFQYVDKKRN